MADSLVFTFEVHRGDEFLFREQIAAESVIIGKGPAAMLRIEDPALADLQAVINLNDDGTVQLLDLVGEGTRVNGEPVVNANLSDGDIVEVGPIRIRVGIEQGGQPVASPPPAAPPADEEEETAEAAPHAVDEEEEDVTGPRSEAEIVADDISEDVMAFIMRSGTAESDVGIDRSRPKVLEVAEIWNDLIVDVRHYPRRSRPVTVGSATGLRWRMLGQPIAWVGPTAAKVLPWLPPTISEVQEEWRTEFFVAADRLPQDEFPLFDWQGDQAVCNFSSAWAGFIDIGDKRYSLGEAIEQGIATPTGDGVYQVVLDDDTRIILDIGHVIFFGQLVYPGRKVVASITDDLEYGFLGILAFMAFLGLLLAVIVATRPPGPESDVMEIPDRFVELLLQQPEIEKNREKNKPDANPDAGEGAKAKKEEGKVGKKDAKMKKAKGNKVELKKREMDKEIAENAGVLGALRDGSELDGVFGSSGLSSDIAGGIGGLIGAKGTQIGSGGLGSRGSGLGGGGTASGLGGLGTKGRGSGASGYGSGGGNLGAKGEGGIGRVGGDPIILGALDKSLIDQVIKRHMNQIRYCYQRELNKSPSLAGKVTVKFVIAKDGSVSSASIKTSTLKNAAVEGCIKSRFMRFRFPEPKGGGIVIVSYPFIFSPG